MDVTDVLINLYLALMDGDEEAANDIDELCDLHNLGPLERRVCYQAAVRRYHFLDS